MNYAANPNTAQWAFPLNEASAERAGKGGFIQESGEYIITIKRGEYSRAKTGTHGLKVIFDTEDGQQGSVILNYQKNNGEHVFGADFINAILFLTSTPGFNWVQGADEKGAPVNVAKELQGLKVGAVLEAVGYTKEDGTEGIHLEARHFFDPQSRRTAGEIKRNEPASAVAKLLARLTK